MFDVCTTGDTSNISSCQKNLFQFSCGCEQFHYGRSFGFLVINVCHHGEHYETHCILCKISTSSSPPNNKKLAMMQPTNQKINPQYTNCLFCCILLHLLNTTLPSSLSSALPCVQFTSELSPVLPNSGRNTSEISRGIRNCSQYLKLLRIYSKISRRTQCHKHCCRNMKLKARQSFETSEKNYPATQFYIPEE